MSRVVYLTSRCSPSNTDWHRGEVTLYSTYVKVEDSKGVSVYPIDKVLRIGE